jgi:hypothetical protein
MVTPAVASYARLDVFYGWTVPARMSVILFFGAFVALGLRPPRCCCSAQLTRSPPSGPGGR